MNLLPRSDMNLIIAEECGASLGEKRSKPRIDVPFPAIVRGIGRDHKKFEVETCLDSLSGDSLYFRIVYPVEIGAALSVVFFLSTSASAKPPVPRIKIQGIVKRIDQKLGGAFGLVVTFNRTQFL